MTEEQKRLRDEHSDRIGKGYYLDKLPHECCNCGSTNRLEYHHIVPITQGGTNRLSNITVVCNQCHKAIHGYKEAKSYKTGKAGGRHARVSAEIWQEVLDRYIHCQIGLKEAKEALKQSQSSKMTDDPRYRNFLKDHGIVKARNNIDIITANGEMRSGRKLGWIMWENGLKEELYS